MTNPQIIKKQRPEDTWSEKEHLWPGIWVYRNVLTPDLNLVNRIDTVIDSSNGILHWNDASVGYKQTIKNYRDCVDFKVRKLEGVPNKDQYTLALDEIWEDAYRVQKAAADDYCKMYNVNMEYWEAMNFIKYGPGQHFKEHSDHGFSYYCTVSLVGYLNDGYEGGGLYFNKLGLNIQPKAGDLYIFPSTYLFSHTALPVTSGMKHSVVTMLDYNDNAHTPGFNRKFE